MKSGLEPILNRAASPDIGGWWATGIFAFKAGTNVLRLEHKQRFPYFKKILIAPTPLPEGIRPPKTHEQLAREYDVNRDFLKQWIDRLRRSRGAPASVFYAWHAFGVDASLDDWLSPAAKHFADFRPADRRALAAHYESLFRQAVSQWQERYPEAEVDFNKRERYKKGEDERNLEDDGLEELRRCCTKSTVPSGLRRIPINTFLLKPGPRSLASNRSAKLLRRPRRNTRKPWASPKARRSAIFRSTFAGATGLSAIPRPDVSCEWSRGVSRNRLETTRADGSNWPAG